MTDIYIYIYIYNEAAQIVSLIEKTEECILCNQRDATYTMFFIIICALQVSGGISAHHQ
jgi:hypothetical protein